MTHAKAPHTPIQRLPETQPWRLIQLERQARAASRRMWRQVARTTLAWLVIAVALAMAPWPAMIM